MTNGEKFQQIFAVSQVDECDLNVYAWLPIHDAIEIPLEWWNANYSEIPTGSTDCISRQAVIDLMMQKWGENFSGDDAMQESIDAIRVMPSVTPQEPRWISVSEKLPKDLEPVNITWINHDPEPYYNDIKDKPFTATGVYFNGQWYWWSALCTDILAEYSHNYDDIIDNAIEVTAWMPLPSSYKRGKEV